MRIATPMLAALALGACATGPAPVEVTRFVAEQPSAPLGSGTIAIEAAPGLSDDNLELRAYRDAVARELAQLGYARTATGAGSQVAEVRVARSIWRPERTRGPVSVGVGGSTGGYRSGVGIGLGIDLSGKPDEQVATELFVTIRDRASGEALWEGRAEYVAKANSDLAQTQAAAARLAEALFVDFPGESGETFEVE